MTAEPTERLDQFRGMLPGAVVVLYAAALVAFVFVGPILLGAWGVPPALAIRRVVLVDAVGYLVLAVVVLR
jgi:hypothetical protein